MQATSRAPTFQSKSRQRRRSERVALDHLDNMVGLPPARRLKARDRIRLARRPLVEARKITREVLAGAGPDRETALIDFSDVQELRVKLLRRDLVLCPEQESWLNRLDKRIAGGRISPAEFRSEAAEILAMPNSLPVQHRKAEGDHG